MRCGAGGVVVVALWRRWRCDGVVAMMALRRRWRCGGGGVVGPKHSLPRSSAHHQDRGSECFGLTPAIIVGTGDHCGARARTGEHRGARSHTGEHRGHRRSSWRTVAHRRSSWRTVAHRRSLWGTGTHRRSSWDTVARRRSTAKRYTLPRRGGIRRLMVYAFCCRAARLLYCHRAILAPRACGARRHAARPPRQRRPRPGRLQPGEPDLVRAGACRRRRHAVRRRWPLHATWRGLLPAAVRHQCAHAA
jgi:hypothetical protein